MYPLNRTGQKSKNLTNNNMYICMYIESVRQSISVKIHHINTDFLLSEKTFLSSISLEFFYFFFVVKSFSYSNFLTLDNGSAL